MTRTTIWWAALTTVAALSSSHVSAQEEEYVMRRFHAQFCGYTGDYPEDLRVFGWEVAANDNDGRIENGSGGVFPQTRELVCPVITDVTLPHQDVARAVVHGIDDSDEVEVEVYACLGSYEGLVAECAPSSMGGGPAVTYSSFANGALGSDTSNVTPTGPFIIPVDVSVFTAHDSDFQYERGYPVLIIQLPTNEDTRITGYTICADDYEGAACDELLGTDGPP